MSTTLSRLKELVDLLSEIQNAPPAPVALSKALDAYRKALVAAKEEHDAQEKSRDLLAEIANRSAGEARKLIDGLSDSDFKTFCQINKIKPAKGKAAKRTRGRVVQKAVKAKAATKKTPARSAQLEIREPDILVPAVTPRQATTEIILNHATRLKSQATI